MRLAAGCCAVVISVAAVARAEPPPHCSGPKLVLEPPLSHRRAWSEAATGARRRVDQLTDVDACTRLKVEQSGGAIQVEASAADGRSVVRELAGPSELEPTVVALLVLPPHGEHDDDLASVTPHEKPAAPAPPPKPAAPAPKAATASASADRGVTAAGAGTKGYARHSLELALGGSARSASYLLGPGASLLVNARLDGWLLGGMAHAEQTSSSTSSPSHFSTERSASFGLVVGRRLVTAPFYLDVALEAPILAVTTSEWTAQTVEGQSAEPGEFEPGSDDTEESTQRTVTTQKVVAPHADLRAGGLIRAVVPLGAGFGAFSQIDVEQSLGLVEQPSVENQPRVIAFSAGVSLGVFWGSL